MPCVVTHAVNTNDVMLASQTSLVLKTHKKIFMCLPFMKAEGCLLKLTPSHINSLNMKNADENVMTKILVTM